MFCFPTVIDILKIIAGNIFITLSYAFLIVPYKIINGGVTSSALILHSVTGLDIATLAKIATILLLLLCLVFLGKEYFFKSILSSLCYMLFFNLFLAFNFSVHLNITAVILIASISLSIGYYLCIAANASTVGFDVLALIFHHKNKKIDIAIAIQCINLMILLAGLSVYGFTSIISGIAFTFVHSYLLRKLLYWNLWNRTLSQPE